MTTTATTPSFNPGGPKSIQLVDMSVEQIQHAAESTTPTRLRGASLPIVLASARKLGESAIAAEAGGDLKVALHRYIQVASILRYVINLPEFNTQKTTLLPQFSDLMKWNLNELVPRATKIKEKLRAAQQSKSNPDEGPNYQSGGSVADRIRALQNHGLQTSSKRVPPPAPPKPASLSASSPTFPSPTPSIPSALPSPSLSTVSSPHAFVSLSSFGPPSPNSSEPNSPRLPESSPLPSIPALIRAPSPEFDKAFPPLQQWEDELNNRFPAVPENLPGIVPSTPISPRSSIPPLTPSRRFPVLPIERPASTPIPPTRNNLTSLPASPNRSPTSDTSEVPNSLDISPMEVRTIQGRGKKVLFLDIRTRDAYEKERIKGEVVCIEPHILLRDGLTRDKIEQALELSPSDERILFLNRHTFTVVVIYDDESSSPNNATEALTRAIYEMEFRRPLKRAPMILRGGLKEWIRCFGEDSVYRGADRQSGSPTFNISSPPPPSAGSSRLSREPTGESISGRSQLSMPLPNPFPPSPGIPSSLMPGGASSHPHPSPAMPSQGFTPQSPLLPSPLVQSSLPPPISPAVSHQSLGANTGVSPSQPSTPYQGPSPLYPSLSGSGSGANGSPQMPLGQPPQPIQPSTNGYANGINGLNGLGSPPPSSSTFSPSPPSSLQNGMAGPPPVNAPSSHPAGPRPRSGTITASSAGTEQHAQGPAQGPSSSQSSNQPQNYSNGTNGREYWVYKGDQTPGYSDQGSSSTPLYISNPNSNENAYGTYTGPDKRLMRKPQMWRPGSSSQLNNPFGSSPLPEQVRYQDRPASYPAHYIGSSAMPSMPTPLSSGPIVYPQQPLRTASPTHSGSSSQLSSQLHQIQYFRPAPENVVSPPPQASINPSSLSRRRSDYLDQSQAALSSIPPRVPIDYPEIGRHPIRPPPPVAPPSTERHDQRPRISSISMSTPYSEYPVMYWSDYQVSTSGLKNLGNTCYMNSTIQCLSATYPFAVYFTDGRWKNAVNKTNKMGSSGALAAAFASILHQMRQGDIPYLTPHGFRKSICTVGPQFQGADQHDAQEFLSFLLNGLHEDLNRITNKPPYTPSPEREAELETLPQQIASPQEWKINRMQNDSIIVDYFMGQFRNRLQCLTCGKTSTTYNPFMDLSLPIPTGRGITKVSLEQCLDGFVREEILEKSEAWHCPHCKTLRKASKQLSFSRLPAVLIVVLKRFSVKGPFTDKLETLVDFPIKGLDLTNYMPPPLPPGADRGQIGPTGSLADDPSVQVPPYRYDLFGVTNHFGSLSSGHYTAFIAARGGWQYCDDSRVVAADPREIVGRAAYVLYYKRSKP
ncbi:hypothetical protein SISNIDRAFT_484224 [Sistotremastrum niveocremeum HHB9708]|uniref:ubiquitinyl hydrolase 1 n=1 Tax=Sistotremastrum niveocremeum HHB9708 TaxID=1314777 RepID=A0A164W2G7_9AGAM|nr:hypothetical protein SISNIDRAFT_484224 [Sistotremastrum niveocremeum HHB9708]